MSKKNQRHHYSGKNKDHTIKVQLTADLNTEEILATAFTSDHVHDVALAKNHLHEVSPFIPCSFDKGYQGIQQQHAQAYLPFKASRGRSLSPAQRQVNRLHAAIRIRVEHIIRSLKRFRILAGRYRNRRHRFGLRFNLIAAIHNFEITLAA